eukprot:TRINITY_DN10534_c0_g1_i4.p1 TRINITY_DN10534_c0_g1~~TRINITY_DN10534_c0_g1_i4.p1  ORF type:complete len:1007 (+),score=285.16 TRINITY_DN10534_c0_g1_i4:134-3154(+)
MWLRYAKAREIVCKVSRCLAKLSSIRDKSGLFVIMDDISGAEELLLPTFPDPEGILRDDPMFYHQLDDVVQQADMSYTVLERLLHATTALADATERYRQAIRATSAALRGAAKQYRAINTPNETPLLNMADMISDLDTCFSTALAQLEASCNSGLSESINKFRTMFDYKSQLNQSHLKYTATMSRFCSTGFGENGIVSDEFHRRSHKAYAARKNAHLTAADCTSMLVETLALEKINVMQMVLQGLFAQVAFFQQGAEQIGQHDTRMNDMFAMLQSMRLKAQAAVDIENEQLEAVKSAAVARHTTEVALIPQAAEKSSNFVRSLKQVVKGKGNNVSGRRRRGGGSSKWRTKSKKERGAAMPGFGANEVNVDDDAASVATTTMGVPQAHDVEVISEKQGYVFRRHKDKRWKLDSLAIRNNCLCRLGDDGTLQELANLLLSTVKMHPTAERHHVFEVVTPNENLYLQALGPQEYAEWIAALNAGIAAALDHGNADKKDAGVQIDPVAYLNQVEGNQVCADCGNEEVEWASINLGIVLCINCSGVHRSLGVHISKVRSILLDRWGLDLLEFMKSRGNQRVNARYEANLSPDVKPTKNTPDTERGQFIRTKYIDKAFEDPSVELSPPYQEHTASPTPTPSSLPMAPVSPLVQAQRSSRPNAPAPPTSRAFDDYQPPPMEKLDKHRHSKPIILDEDITSSVMVDDDDAASDAGSSVALPPITLRDHARKPTNRLEEDTESRGSFGLFDNVTEDLEMDELVEEPTRKPRRSSMMSSLLGNSSERLMFEFSSAAPITGIDEENDGEGEGEGLHDYIEDDASEAVQAKDVEGKKTRLARATATRRKLTRPKRKSQQQTLPTTTEEVRVPRAIPSALHIPLQRDLQRTMSSTSVQSSTSSVFDDPSEIMMPMSNQTQDEVSPLESSGASRRVTTPRMLKTMSFDDAASDSSVVSSRTHSPRMDSQTRAKRNGVMIASVTRSAHNEPAGDRNNSSSSRNELLLAIHSRNSQGSATAL